MRGGGYEMASMDLPPGPTLGPTNLDPGKGIRISLHRISLRLIMP